MNPAMIAIQQGPQILEAMIHADVRQGTALLDLDDPASGYRPVGAFVPAFITEIRAASAREPGSSPQQEAR